MPLDSAAYGKAVKAARRARRGAGSIVSPDGFAPKFRRLSDTPVYTLSQATGGGNTAPSIYAFNAVYIGDVLPGLGHDWLALNSTNHGRQQGHAEIIRYALADFPWGPWTDMGPIWTDYVSGSTNTGEWPFVWIDPNDPDGKQFGVAYDRATVGSSSQRDFFRKTADLTTWTAEARVFAEDSSNIFDGESKHEGYWGGGQIDEGVWAIRMLQGSYSTAGGGNTTVAFAKHPGVYWQRSRKLRRFLNGYLASETDHQFDWYSILRWGGRLWGVGFYSTFDSGLGIRIGQPAIAPLDDKLRVTAKPTMVLDDWGSGNWGASGENGTDLSAVLATGRDGEIHVYVQLGDNVYLATTQGA